MRVLRLHLKSQYWHEIKEGKKLEEFRAANDYWERKLRSAPYDEIHLLLGYPKKGDSSKLIRKKWVGYPPQKRITHPHFDNKPTWVYAIDVTQDAA